AKVTRRRLPAPAAAVVVEKHRAPARGEGRLRRHRRRGDRSGLLPARPRALPHRSLPGLLKTAVLGPSAGHGLNLDAFELKETGLTAALNAAQTLPMFAKRRMVVGRGIDLLKSEELEGLAAYAGDPNPKSCLVLTGEKIDGRLKPFMALKKAGFVHEFPRLRDRELPAWIAREASTRKIAI